MVRNKDIDRSTGPLVVVIDDDETARVSIGQMVRLRGYRTQLFESAREALAWPGLPNSDCIICDVKMPGMGGEEFLARAGSLGFSCPVIMITGHGRVSMAVRCLKAGAYDFVEKPFEDDVLMASIRRAAEKTQLRRESNALKHRLSILDSDQDSHFGIVGRSRNIQDVFEQIEIVSKTVAPVLIIGETGTGKELVARAIHINSNRSQGPFVALNAAAIPETMIESELFGHAQGAFTGASSPRDGKLVTANGGTLLLDEIESLSLSAQAKLLRVLEDGEVFALGKDVSCVVDIRLLVTTKVDLKNLVRSGDMREDFYHRIMVYSIRIPPLRERLEDLTLLVSHFLRQLASRDGVAIPSIPEDTLGAMLRHGWPGNVRELRHTVERMLITARDGTVGPYLSDDGFGPSRLLSLPTTEGPLRDALEQTERNAIEDALARCKGEVVATASALGISRRALYERMKRYSLNKEDYRS